MELPSACTSTFTPKLEKVKKNSPQTNLLYFRKWNLLAPRLKNSLYFGKWNFVALRLNKFLYFGKWNFLVLIFSQKKAFLIFWEMKTLKKFLIFWEVELSYIWGNGNPEKLLIFQEVTFQAWKIKNKFLCFRKWNFLAPSLKSKYFRKELVNAETETKNLLWRNFLSLVTFL